MTRCPNCGAEVREGAKFCTSCGFRLTEAEAAPPSRSPFAIPPAGAWSSSQASEQADAAAGDRSTQDEVQEETVYTASPTVTDTSDDVDDLDENDRPGPSWYSPKPATSGGPVSDEMLAELEQDQDAVSGEHTADKSEEDHTDGGWVMAQPIEESQSEASSPWSEARDAGETNLMPPRVDPAIDTDGSGTLDEARQLVGRLQELLSGMSSNALGAAGQATPQLQVSDEDVESLRTVVASAQERPRDVDVMLDLVLRADTIAGVIQDRDTLLGKNQGDGAGDSSQGEDDDTSSDPASSWPTR